MNSQSIVDRLDWDDIQGRLRLSPREVEVSRWICRGIKIRDIAKKMRLGEGTVKTYCRRLYRKLGVECQCGMALVIAAAGQPTTTAARPRIASA